jgi:hypothetical protein
MAVAPIWSTTIVIRPIILSQNDDNKLGNLTDEELLSSIIHYLP